MQDYTAKDLVKALERIAVAFEKIASTLEGQKSPPYESHVCRFSIGKGCYICGREP